MPADKLKYLDLEESPEDYRLHALPGRMLLRNWVALAIAVLLGLALAFGLAFGVAHLLEHFFP